MTKHHVQLSPSDREYLQQLVRQDNVGVKVYRRARVLLHLDQGATLQSAAALVEAPTIFCFAHGWLYAAKHRSSYRASLNH